MQEVNIIAVLIKEEGVIDRFHYSINSESKARLVRKRLELERSKIVDFFKKLKEEGKIGSIYKPRNRHMQDHINRMIKAKKDIDESVKKIRDLFYK